MKEGGGYTSDTNNYLHQKHLTSGKFDTRNIWHLWHQRPLTPEKFDTRKIDTRNIWHQKAFAHLPDLCEPVVFSFASRSRMSMKFWANLMEILLQQSGQVL